MSLRCCVALRQRAGSSKCEGSLEPFVLLQTLPKLRSFFHARPVMPATQEAEDRRLFT